MLKISKRVTIPANEIEISAIRSQGAGGQNVNKVATAIHLRFDIKNSSLPQLYKDRLLALKDNRINNDGIIIIKSQEERSQKQNRERALERLRGFIKSVMVTRKKRIPTKPTKSSQVKRLDSKSKHSKIKTLRQKIDHTTLSLFLILCFSLSFSLPGFAQQMSRSTISDVKVYPNPKRMHYTGMSFRYERDSKILLHATDNELKAANYFKRLIESKFPGALQIQINEDKKRNFDLLQININLTPDLSSVPNDQYYKIDFEEKLNELKISSPSQLGLLYGVVTASEFFYRSNGHIKIDLFQIEDWPTYQRRIFPVVPDLATLDDLMDFALRYKLETIALASRQYSWKKVDKNFADLLIKIKEWRDRYGGPRIMQRHNIYVGDKIVISNPEDIRALKNVIQTGILNGATKLMILADDTPPFKFGEGYILTDKKDKEKFRHMAEAHSYLINELNEWMKQNSYECEIYFVPAFYTYEDAKYGDMFLYKDTPWEEDAFGPLERDLNYIGKNMSEDVFIVWTGPNVRSRTIRNDDLDQWASLLQGRVPFLWDNTIYSQHPFTTTALFTAYNNKLPENFHNFTAGNGMFINGDSNSEGMQVAAITTNDFLWDPDNYDPEESLITAMHQKYDKKTANLLLEFKTVELSLRKKIGERALWFKADSLWDAIVGTKAVTGKNPFHYHFNYSRLKALRMQLQHSVPEPSSERKYLDECRVLEKTRYELLEEIESLDPEIYAYLQNFSIQIED